jgi:hypothetical protein
MKLNLPGSVRAIVMTSPPRRRKTPSPSRSLAAKETFPRSLVGGEALEAARCLCDRPQAAVAPAQDHVGAVIPRGGDGDFSYVVDRGAEEAGRETLPAVCDDPEPIARRGSRRCECGAEHSTSRTASIAFVDRFTADRLV